VKLTRRVDDDQQAYRLTTVLLVIGATLYYIPQVFAVEAASQEYLAGFVNAFTSNTNPGVALACMWISLAGAIVVVGWLFVRAWNAASRSMARQEARSTTQPADEEKAAVL
jgi:hypothetical protein